MTMTDTTTGSTLVAAIETFWSAVVDRHAELPEHVIVVTGSGRITGGTVLGHWAANRWTVEASRTAELFISGERMGDGGRGVATTVLHEAAHALLHARGDVTGGTSRQHRYHTRKGFVPAAEELGLVAPAAADPTLGFSDCSMPDETAERYAAEIAALDEALAAHIVMVAIETLQAWALLVGMLMGAGQTIVAWWVPTDLVGLWGRLGGGITKPRRPRVRRPRILLACGCRDMFVPADEADQLEDLDCRRCGEALERQP